MNLKTSKRVLKVTGVIMIIGAILNLLIGSLGLAGGIYAANAPVIQADETLALGTGVILIVSLATLICGIFYIIEGIVTAKAAKNSKFGTAAWVFAILGILATIGRVVTSFTNDGITGATVFVAVIAVGISLTILVAANTVRKANKGIIAA